MKYLFGRMALVVCAVILAANVAGAQSVSETISKIGDANVKNYVNPLFKGMASAMNSGFYHTADLHSILGFDVGVKLAVLRFDDTDKLFDFKMPDRVNTNINGFPVTLIAGVDYDKTTSGAATSVGSKGAADQKEIKIKTGRPGAGTVLMKTPKGSGLPAAPGIAPQFSIGLPLGLEVVGRFLPKYDVPDVGKLGMIGYGFRHDIDQYLPFMPIDIAVHYFRQKLTLDDPSGKNVMSISSSSLGMEVSKRLLILTLYGGFEIQNSEYSVSDVQGEIEVNGVKNSFTLQGFSEKADNKSRVVVGARILLLILNVHAEYSIATKPMLTLGVGISLR